jgi:hypothetical protein
VLQIVVSFFIIIIFNMHINIVQKFEMTKSFVGFLCSPVGAWSR